MNPRALIVLSWLLVQFPAYAVVTCANENTAVPATTPTSHFVIRANGTASDLTTGLMWMRCSVGQTWTGSTCTGVASTHTWQDALQAAQSLNADGGFAGHGDWRLPNKNELESIIERRCWSPAINAAVFPGTPSTWFWSSSSYAVDPSGAWNVDFDYGELDWFGKVDSYGVRLVRAGQ